MPRRPFVAVVALALAAAGCTGTAELDTAVDDASVAAAVEPALAGAATPEPTAIPEPSPTAEPTAEPESTPEPEPTLEPEPAQLPEPTAEPTAERITTPEPSDPPLAIRTELGVMLTVVGDETAAPWRVVTPCFNTALVDDGLAVRGDVDVLIDPGHGGDEIGATGPNGLLESKLNLLVSEALRERLLAAGYRVLMTRYSDHRVAIQARAELANALQPRLFISIHHNGGFPNPVDRPGTEMFVQRGDEESARIGGLLFEEIQAEFADEPGVAWVGTDALGVSWRVNERETDLYGVLRRTPELVSVLTEAMYMTEETAAEFLATPDAVEREADALFRGIERWFETADPGSGFIDGLVFRGDLGPGGGTDGCVDPPGLTPIDEPG